MLECCTLGTGGALPLPDRALASLYVRVGGQFIAMKGAMAEAEAEEAARAIDRLGGTLARIEAYPVADATHYAVVIEKRRPTPPGYPRAYAKIKKSPL